MHIRSMKCQGWQLEKRHDLPFCETQQLHKTAQEFCTSNSNSKATKFSMDVLSILLVQNYFSDKGDFVFFLQNPEKQLQIEFVYFSKPLNLIQCNAVSNEPLGQTKHFKQSCVFQFSTCEKRNSTKELRSFFNYILKKALRSS